MCSISTDGVDIGYVLREVPLARFMLKSWMLDAMHEVAGKGAEFNMEGVGDDIMDDMQEKSETAELQEALEEQLHKMSRKMDSLKVSEGVLGWLALYMHLTKHA